MACIKKRRGRWVADYRDATGKRHWESYDTRKEAEQALAGHVTALKDGRYCSTNDKRTVRDAYDSWWRLSVEGSDNRSGAELRPTTRALYLWTWNCHVERRWAERKLLSIGAEEVASWQQELLGGGLGPKGTLNAVQLLGSLLKHARRFKWIATNVCEDVRKPRYKVKVRAFTAAEVAVIASAADERTALLVRTAASTGLRFGEIAGLEWKQIDLEKGIIAVARQFTHSAWSELKTANSRRRIPVARELLHQLKLHRLRTQGELVFPGGEGKPIDYHNWRARVWAPLLKVAGVTGTFHMLRHFFVTALIQSGVNAKVAQTLAGHHSASFTLDQYADAVPEQLEEAGELVASVLLAASGSKTVAAPKSLADRSLQVIEGIGAPGGIRTPDPQVRSLMLYPTELRARRTPILS
jgi:integrase